MKGAKSAFYRHKMSFFGYKLHPGPERKRPDEDLLLPLSGFGKRKVWFQSRVNGNPLFREYHSTAAPQSDKNGMNCPISEQIARAPREWPQRHPQMSPAKIICKRTANRSSRRFASGMFGQGDDCWKCRLVLPVGTFKGGAGSVPFTLNHKTHKGFAIFYALTMYSSGFFSSFVRGTSGAKRRRQNL